MNKKWIPIASGILIILGGTLQLLAPLCTMFRELSLPVEFAMASSVLVITSILAIVGGFYVLRRKKWYLALAVSIVAFLPLLLWYLLGIFMWFEQEWVLILILGIAAVVLSVLSKKESEQQEKLMLIMKKTWMPITAGILEILAGIVPFVVAPLFLFLIGIEAPRPLQPWYFLWVLVPALFGVLPLIGGVCALLRIRWRLAFWGAMATIPVLMVIPRGVHYFDEWYFQLWNIFISIWPLLISAAIIALIVLSKKQFKK
jgi:hypothetical protein